MPSSLYLSWDNTAILAEANVIAQRAYYRIKTVGGAFLSTGFSPANDLSTAITFTELTPVVQNKVYEFKVIAICTAGGPTDNSNGIIEQIAFACIEPVFTNVTTSVIDVVINIPTTDITKARLRLKKQSDNSVVSTATVNKIANAITHSFTGLDDNTGYYLEVEFYAVVGGIEVISSSVSYLGAVCGGNVSGYQATTDAIPVYYQYEAVSYDCGTCTPAGTFIVESLNAALVLTKYYSELPISSTVYRIVATSLLPATIIVDDVPADTCAEACGV